ncbi:MAG: AraC family transcriptional regulator [Nocardioides sp.]|nr:AraC family transcriptional regulator [Nocardioides sp.]
MTDHTVPIEFVRAALAIGKTADLDVVGVLDRAGVSPRLVAENKSRITSEQVACVVRELWIATGDELFGLGRVPLANGSTRLIGLSLVHTVDLRAAIQRFVEFQRLTPGFPRVMVVEAGNTVRMTMDTSELQDPDSVFTTFLMAAWHRVFAWLIGQRIRLEAVELPQAEPRNVEDYQEVFGGPVFFSAETAAIEFEGRLLDHPVVQTEESWLAYTTRAPFDILNQREYGVALADRVRSILARDKRVRTSGDEVAKALAMSPQTLRRRLTLENTSVTAIRDQILRDEAVTRLVRGDETIEELSERLGFSEPSAFRRAFRRWTGSPPRAYQHQHGPSGVG